jgi:hypothetical protein
MLNVVMLSVMVLISSAPPVATLSCISVGGRLGSNSDSQLLIL